MNKIDKIVLSKDRSHCVVYYVNGPSLFFDFFRLGMTYIDFIDWIQEVTYGPEIKAA
jgi:hypothetical protein